MINKKTLWLGLIVSLAVTPFLVAQLTPPAPNGAAPLPVGTPLPVVPASAVADTANVLPPAALPQDKLPQPTPLPQPINLPQPEPTTPAPLNIPAPNEYSGLTKPSLPANTRQVAEGGNKTDIAAPAAVTGSSASVADVIGSSNASQGVEIQKRSPVVGDPRIEGLHFGEIVTTADGGYWFPARVDLDTVISKLNTADINNIQIIKGPFSVRYGPGFSFLDVESVPTYRSGGDYFDAHGSTSLSYRTNGEAWAAQQSVMGGNKDWGFNITYDIKEAGDYTTGNGTKMPSSYNNQFVNFAFGIDLSKTSNIEIRYMHVEQNNLLIPGLVTDINNLTSDALTVRYTSTQGAWYDRLTIDAWFNNTTFNGDSSNPQTRAQIPILNSILVVQNGNFQPVRLDITTNGNAVSYGARETTIWGDIKGFNIASGADLRVFSNVYNEFDSFNFSLNHNQSQPGNLGIPYSRTIDPGLFADVSLPWGDKLNIKAGARVDFVTNQFIDFGPQVNNVQNPNPASVADEEAFGASYIPNVGNPNGDKTFFLFSAYVTGEYKINDNYTARAGYGYAERPPTLTELYAGGALLGLIQNGLNSFYGNVNLRKEEMHQLMTGIDVKYDDFRATGSAFYSAMPNYITYAKEGVFANDVPVNGTTNGTQLIGTGLSAIQNPTFGTGINILRFKNTNLATMYGFDGQAEFDAQPWLTPFAGFSYVSGWDATQHIPLPGIPPLDSRIGLRFHDPAKEQKWAIEYYARVVADQDQFAYNLGEERTGGFVTHNIRAYWQATKSLLLLAGVDNFGNLQYREHLDLRTGDGVYQPGISFYFGMKVSY